MVYSMITVQRTAGSLGICNPRSSQHRGGGRTEMICDTVAGKRTVWTTASGPPRREIPPKPHFSPCRTLCNKKLFQYLVMEEGEV